MGASGQGTHNWDCMCAAMHMWVGLHMCQLHMDVGLHVC